MKVYVMTKAELFQPEVYIGVKGKKKDAEKELRTKFPHMRKDDLSSTSGIDSYTSDASSKPLLLFIHEEEV